MNTPHRKPATPGCNLRVLPGTTWYRSDALTGLGSQTKVAVEGLGLRTVIDLRSEEERRESPCDLAEVSGIDYRAVDLSGGLKGRGGSPLDGTGIHDLADLYLAFLDKCQHELRSILELLVQSKGPALFHCAAGKDRTGVVAMLALGLRGADDQTIVRDYLATKDAIVPLLPFLASGVHIRRAGAAGLRFLETEERFIRAAIDRVHQRYGGFEAYARDHLGLAPLLIQEFRG